VFTDVEAFDAFVAAVEREYDEGRSSVEVRPEPDCAV
jgi:hypothetical protein